MQQFIPCDESKISQLMAIEQACHSHPWSEKTFLSCLHGRYFGYYLTDNQQILGFYIGEHVAGEATLMDICVLPKVQGQGLGKTLLAHFLQEAKAKGNKSCWLEVRAKNFAAQMLYISHGFIEINRRTGYYPSNSGQGGYEDAIVMSLAFDKKQQRKK